MAASIVRLGTPRRASEGLRIGTVRRPPRGVPKAEYATRDWFDVWLPNLSPNPDTMKLVKSAASEADWAHFFKRFRAEMTRAESSRVLDLLAALSHDSDFSVGCYCADEMHCHRSVLRALLEERGAQLK